MFEKFEEFRKRKKELENQLGNPEILKDKVAFERISSEYQELEEKLNLYDRFLVLEEKIKEIEEIIKETDDKTLLKIAQEEKEELLKEKKEIEEKLKSFLTPDDPLDKKNAIVEIRAGVGGEEAALFAADLFRMYLKFAQKKNFKVEILSQSRTPIGGFKEIIFKVSGYKPYGTFKYESGVHRVQRVPKTEAGGRIHTSTATVAVLPEAEPVDIKIDPADLRIDVFRSSGPGGQSVNTTDSAVRITHLPTGIVVTCQDERSQLKNKAKALSILRTRLFALKQEEERKKEKEKRKVQIGTAERSEKIRTYNFPQDRVTDHRVKKTWHNLEAILDGDLDDIIEALKLKEQS